jgi:hypothetical protein
MSNELTWGNFPYISSSSPQHRLFLLSHFSNNFSFHPHRLVVYSSLLPHSYLLSYLDKAQERQKKTISSIEGADYERIPFKKKEDCQNLNPNATKPVKNSILAEGFCQKASNKEGFSQKSEGSEEGGRKRRGREERVKLKNEMGSFLKDKANHEEEERTTSLNGLESNISLINESYHIESLENQRSGQLGSFLKEGLECEMDAVAPIIEYINDCFLNNMEAIKARIIENLGVSRSDWARLGEILKKIIFYLWLGDGQEEESNEIKEARLAFLDLFFLFGEESIYESSKEIFLCRKDWDHDMEALKPLKLSKKHWKIVFWKL